MKVEEEKEKEEEEDWDGSWKVVVYFRGSTLDP
jgi:hypothetical protein